MDNANQPAKSAARGKKEVRKQLADKISAAIPELQLELGDKKFHHRIKKAVKLIMEGMHKKEETSPIKKVKAVKAKALKKAIAKKAKKSVSKTNP